MNTRFDLDPKIVVDQTAKKCNEYLRHLRQDIMYTLDALSQWYIHPELFTKRPRSIAEIYKICMLLHQRELMHYSTVRVIHTPNIGYFLVYGDILDADVTDGNGTGPFKSEDEAQQWFLNGGR